VLALRYFNLLFRMFRGKVKAEGNEAMLRRAPLPSSGPQAATEVEP